MLKQGPFGYVDTSLPWGARNGRRHGKRVERPIIKGVLSRTAIQSFKTASPTATALPKSGNFVQDVADACRNPP
jgi:hypothetical protein